MTPSESTGNRPSRVSLTTVFTVGFGAVLVVAVVFFLLRTRVALTLTLGSALAAVAMDHAVEALVRRGLRRSWAIGAVMVAVTTLLVGVGLLLVPPIVAQVRALADEAPALWQKLLDARWFRHLDDLLDLQERLRESGPAAVGAVNPILSAIGGIATALAGLVACSFLAVFMLIFGRDLVAAFFTQLQKARRESYQRVVTKVYRSVGGYLGGLLGICAINATLTTAFLAIIQVPFFLPLGILSGGSSLLPYVGPMVAGAAITLFVLVTAGPWPALAAAIYFLVYGQLEGNVLAPFVYRRTTHVNPLVTLLAILFLAEFMGMMRAVVAVPVAAAIQVVVAEVVSLRRDRARLLLERQDAPPSWPARPYPGEPESRQRKEPSVKSDMRSENVVREGILELLSDEEVARVSTAEAAAHLAEGEEYLDLEQLGLGVRRALGATAPMGRVLPRKAVHGSTWLKILAQLRGADGPAARPGV
jgi:putative heme transporter